jgi:hypothetical protein
MALSLQANYTDLAPTFADRGVSHGQRSGSPTVVNLSFLDRIIQPYIHKIMTACFVYNPSYVSCYWMQLLTFSFL